MGSEHHRSDEKDVQSLLVLGAPSGAATASFDLEALFPEIIGTSPTLKKALRVVAQVARSNSSVLLLGESGTGKELIASAIHRLSDRNLHRFVAINCSAIPETLLEAELFGHERGAFTGADRKRVGLFGTAHRGSIFLDEIGDMPTGLQVKLLRVLQEKSYSPVGSHVTQSVDARIIAATNKHLEKEVQEGRFRLDLFYRLNVFPIHLPALRERPEDIPALLRHFCEKQARMGQRACWFSDSAITRLQHYDWPGNIRELQNLVERLSITSEKDRIDADELSSLGNIEAAVPRHEGRKIEGASAFPKVEVLAGLPSEGVNLTSYIENLENALILEALRRTSNNKNQASKLLGINRTTLVEKIKKRQLSF
jgi:transcriptional regulator with PAS, ATPase and Fis domain